MKISQIIIYALFLLSGCTSSPTITTLNEGELSKNKWILYSLAGTYSDAMSYPRGLPWLDLKPNATAFTGFGGCNQMSGIMNAIPGKIEFKNITSTRMYCEGVNESGFVTALNSSNAWTIENDMLYFYSGKVVTAVFKRD